MMCLSGYKPARDGSYELAIKIDGSGGMLNAISGRAKVYILDKASLPSRCTLAWSVIDGKFDDLLADIDTVLVFGL
jgi:hypothetical protein